MHPDTIWHLTLGTPTIDCRRISEKLIKEIEGLLIYSHWHDECANRSKINSFFSSQYILIENTGFSDPFYPQVGFGPFVTNVEE
jgi:hypothetical protein